LSLAELAHHIQNQEISPVEATEASLAAIDVQNDRLNAFRLVLADEALAAARQAEQEIGQRGYRGPLHGVPLAIKDLMDMRGTTAPAGSMVLAERVAGQDAEVVGRLREAGAVLVGKTHMPEFAYMISSANSHHGPVRNPWHHEHDTGGSSSGSAAALAARLVFGATGTDTGGSIRVPCALCGLSGIKPTFGRVSGRGCASLSWSLDHIGPMARTVRDTALLLDAMAGYDPDDPRTKPIPAGGYVESLEEGVAGLRVAVLTDDGSGQPLGTRDVLDACAAGTRALEDAGASVDEVAVPEIADLGEIMLLLSTLELAATYEPYLVNDYDRLDPVVRQRMIVAYVLSPTDTVRVSQVRSVLRRAFEERLAGFDLLVLPTAPHVAPPLGVTQQNGRLTRPISVTGWPAASVPVGIGERGLPIGLQLVGRPWREATVLRAARVVERDGPWSGRSPML
jgi:aspartyl-tRNA(Asn)/glutamyl-tRNA(Gln) amidotransferase subunit A